MVRAFVAASLVPYSPGTPASSIGFASPGSEVCRSTTIVAQPLPPATYQTSLPCCTEPRSRQKKLALARAGTFRTYATSWVADRDTDGPVASTVGCDRTEPCGDGV